MHGNELLAENSIKRSKTIIVAAAAACLSDTKNVFLVVPSNPSRPLETKPVEAGEQF